MLRQPTASHERLHDIIRLAPIGIGIVDLDGRAILTNNALRDMLGYSQEEFAALHFDAYTHPEDVERNQQLFAEMVAGRREHFKMDKRFIHSDGSIVWGRLTVSLLRDESGAPSLNIGMLENITEQRRLEAELQHQAFHDSLTNLANRALFTDRVEQCLRRRGRRTGAVLFIDLDDFKTVNDSLGHAAGDELIRSVAGRIRDCLRPADTAGRLGGDEFAILLEELSDPSDALRAAERVLGAIQRPHHLEHKSVVTAASIGVAYLADAGSSVVALRNADLAMYDAKRGGKGRVATYAPELHRAVVRTFDLRQALEEALVRNEFTVVFQPIVDLVSGRIRGAEALLRWHHPVYGAIPPNDFIPIAEESGAIGRLDAWVLERSCDWLAGLHRRGHDELSVSVNVSPVELQNDSLVTTVRWCLARSGLDPRSLILEVTEGGLMSERSWAALHELKALGVRIAIDDFGTGYASLAYLGELAADLLKIDRSFVSRLGTGDRAEAVPRAVIQLAAALGLGVVAEGIETQEQSHLLQRLGCRAGQGFLFAEPASPDAVEALLTTTAALRAWTPAA